jgi:hypothetical protein
LASLQKVYITEDIETAGPACSRTTLHAKFPELTA